MWLSTFRERDVRDGGGGGGGGREGGEKERERERSCQVNTLIIKIIFATKNEHPLSYRHKTFIGLVTMNITFHLLL